MGRPLIVPKLVSIGYPLRLGAKLLFFPQLKIVRSERDVVAVARFSNFKSLSTHNSFDMHEIPKYR